jgi:hypothetical protein
MVEIEREHDSVPDDRCKNRFEDRHSFFFIIIKMILQIFRIIVKRLADVQNDRETVLGYPE